MIEISLGSVLVIAGLLMTFFFYVASVSYRLGKLEQRVETNESAILEGKAAHATKSDFDNIEKQLVRMEGSISKLFDLLRESQSSKNQ